MRWAALRTDDRLRSAVRFAVSVGVADAIALHVYASTAAAVMTSFAVIVMLYFLDFGGIAVDRLAGYTCATGLGVALICSGVAVAWSTPLSLVAAFVVVAAVSYARILRGYVSRSVVGLSAAFLWPVMLPAQVSELGTLVGAWLVGCAVAVVAALVVLPHRRTGLIRKAMVTWLHSAGAFVSTQVAGPTRGELVAAMSAASGALARAIASPSCSLGAVGPRDRALAEMASRALWAEPLAASTVAAQDPRDEPLATATATAFVSAASLVEGGSPKVPDLEGVRAAHLASLGEREADALTTAYPLRLVSDFASLQLWLAGLMRGRRLPRPEVGDVSLERPWTLIWRSIGRRSVWLRTALLAGVGAAICVAIVRALGIEHGLWVALAAIICFQGSFSAMSGWRRLVGAALGAATGVLLGGVLIALRPSHAVFLLLLPLAAFGAKAAQGRSVHLTQFAFTVFVLVNIAVLQFPPDLSLASDRLRDITLGAAVAALLTCLFFPTGIRGLLVRLSTNASDAATTYLAAGIARATDSSDLPDRRPVVEAIASFEGALAAGHLAMRTRDPDLAALDRTHARARECLLGGDICAALAERSEAHSGVVAAAAATWWSGVLEDVRREVREAP